MSVYLDEDLLGNILDVSREGIRSVVGRTCSVEFVKKCSKIPTTRRAGLLKKLMKGEYDLVFEFVNKVFLPRTEKRISATSTDLFLMESLCKFEPLDLPAPMIEHMYKTVIERKGKHGMGYGYLLTKVFQYLNIPLGVGKVGTSKQSFIETTLVECECI